MQVTLDFLSQVPRLIRELAAIVQEPIDKRRTRRSEFFDSEIAPAHEAMTAINKDYMESFSELLVLFGAQADLSRTIELLKKKRLVMLSTRKDREAYAEALADIKKRGYIKKQEIAALIAYEKAIGDYLHAASPADARFTWYSAFIDAFESLTRAGESPFGCHYATITSSRPPADLVRHALSEAIQHDIPHAWKDYSGAYHKLRLEMKR